MRSTTQLHFLYFCGGLCFYWSLLVFKWSSRFLTLLFILLEQAEKAKQLPTSSPGTVQDSGRENSLKHAADDKEIEDTFTEMVLYNPNDVQKSCHRKHLESLNRPSKKGQHHRLEPPANSKKVDSLTSESISCIWFLNLQECLSVFSYLLCFPVIHEVRTVSIKSVLIGIGFCY